LGQGTLRFILITESELVSRDATQYVRAPFTRAVA